MTASQQPSHPSHLGSSRLDAEIDRSLIRDAPPAQLRAWTVEDIGRALREHAREEQMRFDALDRQIGHVAARDDEMYRLLIIGNGVPSMRDQLRTHSAWIQSVNKLVWIAVAAFVGQGIVFGCSLIFGVIGLLIANGIIKP